MNSFVNSPPAIPAAQRALSCARCGTAFTCDLSGQCWCAEETAKLPMPTGSEDCLCRACLRAEAARQTSA